MFLSRENSPRRIALTIQRYNDLTPAIAIALKSYRRISAERTTISVKSDQRRMAKGALNQNPENLEELTSCSRERLGTFQTSRSESGE